MHEYTLDPCPWRILDDAGGGFIVGGIGGGIFHSIMGFRNAPVGLNRKILNSLSAIKGRSVITASYCAVWGMLFRTFDCSLVHVRQEDGWNSIISGALSGSIITARNGVPAMARNFLLYGIFFALLEVTNFAFTIYWRKKYSSP